MREATGAGRVPARQKPEINGGQAETGCVPGYVPDRGDGHYRVRKREPHGRLKGRF
jgi:hypothetical protein